MSESNEIKFEKEDNLPPREKVETEDEVPENGEDLEGLRRFEGKWRKEEQKSEEESREELDKAHQKVAEAKREKEERKKSIFERIKEFVGLSKDELIRFDDLVSDNSEDAWRMREEKTGENKKIIATAAGIKSKRAEEFLNKTVKLQENWRVVSLGLMYNDTAWADGIKNYLKLDKGRIRAGRWQKVFKVFNWHKSERFFKRRQTLDQILGRGFYLPGDLLLSETGVPATNETKQKLWKEFKNYYPVEAILCHLGDSSIVAQDMVEKIYDPEKKEADKKLKWAYDLYENSIGKDSEKE